MREGAKKKRKVEWEPIEGASHPEKKRKHGRRRGIDGGGGGRGNEKWKVSNESRNNLCSLLVSFPPPLLSGRLILSPSFAPYGRAAYVFRCTDGCTTPNGVSNIFLSVDPRLLSAPLCAPPPPLLAVDRLPNSFSSSSSRRGALIVVTSLGSPTTYATLATLVIASANFI